MDSIIWKLRIKIIGKLGHALIFAGAPPSFLVRWGHT